jgi:hypothetical protein
VSCKAYGTDSSQRGLKTPRRTASLREARHRDHIVNQGNEALTLVLHISSLASKKVQNGHKLQGVDMLPFLFPFIG